MPTTWRAIARSQKMKASLLLTRRATRSNVLAAIRRAARALKPGDLFVMTYSGHGGQVRDIDGDEADGQDETWCLFDGQLLDDELYFELSRFAADCRILVLSDSCHSGSVTRDILAPAPPGMRSKAMPPAVARRVYDEHQTFYDALQRTVAAQAGKTYVDPDAALALIGAAGQASKVVGKFKPSVVLISGCQDNQTSMDGDFNGAFTEQLLKVWNRGAFDGDHKRFHAFIKAALPASQSPNLFALGKAAAFLKQKPFSV